jgi:toxin ParE1/3/4
MVPTKFTITFALSAVEDLEDIRRWYYDQQIPEVGEKLIKAVLSSLERLTDFPDSGRIVPEFGVPYLKEIIHPPFRIIYRMEKNLISVVRVWRSERLLKMP